MTLLQNGTSFSGSNVSATGIETRDDADCHLWYMDWATGGTASGTVSGNTVGIAFNLPTVTKGTTLYFTGTATLSGNTLSGSILRSMGGTGSITLTRQ